MYIIFNAYIHEKYIRLDSKKFTRIKMIRKNLSRAFLLMVFLVVYLVDRAIEIAIDSARLEN